MGFYVIGDQGQKYGPADILTLNQWIGEGRLVPHSMLEDEVSGGQIVASSIPGLQFPVSAPAPQMPSNYPRPGQTPYANPPQYQPQYQMSTSGGGQSDFMVALLLSLISPVVSFLLPIGGVFTGGYALRSAFRAKNAGHPQAIIVIVLSIAALCFWAFTRITGCGRGILLR